MCPDAVGGKRQDPRNNPAERQTKKKERERERERRPTKDAEEKMDHEGQDIRSWGENRLGTEVVEQCHGLDVVCPHQNSC